MDLSTLSDEQLMQAAGVGGAPASAPMDYSSLSDEQLMQAAGMNFAPQPQQSGAMQQLNNAFAQRKGFQDRLGEKYDQRMANIDTIANREKSGDLNPVSGAFQHIGQYGGLVNDAITEELKSVYNYIPESVTDSAAGRALGQTYRDITQSGRGSLGNPVGYIGDVVSGAGKLAGAGMKALRDYSPDAAANVEAALNIAGAAPVVAGAAKGLGVVGDVGKIIEASGIRAADKQALNLARNIVSPKETVATKAAQKRVEVGLNKKQEIIDPRLDEIAATVSPYIKKGDSLLGNENAISNALSLEAEKLKAALEGSDAVISDDAILQGLANTKKNLDNYAWLQGDGKKAAESVINQAFDIIATKPRTPAGMLDARKELDSLINSQKPSVFDASREAPIVAAVREVRGFMNNIVADTVPDAGVKESLRRQSNMYTALENISSKRAAQPTTRLGRASKAAQDAVSLKGAILGTAAAGGIGLGAAPVVLPALGAYGAYRAAVAPATREIIGKALQLPSKLTISDLQKVFEARKGIQ